MAGVSGIASPAAEAAPRRRLARFGSFEFDRSAQELRKHGLRLKLQGKPLQLLAALIETPGQVLSREELQRRLWPAQTFVDFENGLNGATKRLRAALSDSADQPIYIETLAGAGYRFIAPVEWEVERPAPASHTAAPSAEPSSPRRFATAATTAALAALIGVTATIAWRFAAAAPSPAPVSFQQVTFRRGPVFNARFAPDGHTILFAAQWDSEPRQIYQNNGFSPESRPLGLEGTLLSVSRGGELALYNFGGAMPIAGGDLLRVPVNGGVPVLAEKAVMSADWAPDGKQLAIVRATGGRNTLEYPPGRVLYSTAGWLSDIRFSPTGDRIAFVDHPARHDDGGRLMLTGLDGRPSILTPTPWTVLSGVAWHPGGREVWFSGTPAAAISSLWAIATEPPFRLRSLGQYPGVIRRRDVSSSGTVLLGRESRRLESVAVLPGQPAPRDISWLDWSRAVDVSSQGRVLFDESGEAVGGQGTVFLFDPAKGTLRLGEGWAQALSPDGREALVLSRSNRQQLRVLSLTGEAPRDLPVSGLDFQWARYYPGGQTLLALASQPGQPLRLYRASADGSSPATALTGPGMVRHAAISPDGADVAYLSAEGKLALAPGGRVLADAEPLAPIQWSRNGRLLYVQHLRQSAALPARVSLLEVATGRLTPWRQFAPHDPVGVDQLTRILIAPDERTTVYTVRRILSELFTAHGIR